MKKLFLLLILNCSMLSAQDSLTVFRTQNGFSLSPVSRKVERVNGLVLGVGHFRSKFIDKQTINGINLEASPMGAAGALSFVAGLLYIGHERSILRDTIIPPMPTTCTKINGLNLSSGGFLEGGSVSGLNISVCTIMTRMNGLSISPGCLLTYKLNGVNVGLLTAAKEMRGASIGLCNLSESMKGVQIGGFNHVREFSGVQIGLCNFSDRKSRGLQLGLMNRSKRGGLQIGLVNVNKKRILPFINW